MSSSLKIQPIGTHGAFTLCGFNTNYLVSVRRPDNSMGEFLLDCGTTAGVAMNAIGRQLLNVEDVYASHLHLDHIGGLVQLGLSRYFTGLKRPRLYCVSDLAQKLWPHFLRTFLEVVLSHQGSIEKLGMGDFFELVAFPPQTEKLDLSYAIGGVNCIPVEFSHPNFSKTHGLIIEEKVLITSDTIFLPSTLESVANRYPIEAIFHHCTFNPAKRKLHTLVDELASLPEDLRDLIILIHYDDHLPNLDGLGFELAEPGKIYEF